MIEFFKRKKETEAKTSGEFNIKIDLPLRSVLIRKLTVADFLTDGLMLNFFVEKTGNAGRFAELEKMTNKDQEEEEIKPDQREFIETVLRLGMEEYIDDLFDIEKIIIFNSIIIHSCKKFADIINPDKILSLNCHYLAKHYGGDPWLYLNQSPDQFLFNLYCLNQGLADESAQMKKAMKKQKIK